MQRNSENFYSEFSPQEYLKEVRRFVPGYEAMNQLNLAIACTEKPESIFNIGCGTGELDAVLLHHLPDTTILSLDANKNMADSAKSALDKYGQRASVIHSDALLYNPHREFDMIISNLALHNIPEKDKLTLLRRINNWLKEGGIFIWSDLVRQSSPFVEQKYTEARVRLALEKGADPEFVKENFKKEETDPMLTVEESLAALEKAGFEKTKISNPLTCLSLSVFAARK